MFEILAMVTIGLIGAVCLVLAVCLATGRNP